MRVVRWSAHSRQLPSEEVASGLDVHRDTPVVYAFTTNEMSVGEHAGNFSLKLVTAGKETYHFGRRRVALTPGRVLVTNAGDSYSSEITTRGTRAISCFLPLSVSAVMPIPFRPSGDTSRRLAGLASLVESGREIQLDMAEELLLLAAGGVIADATGLIQVDTLSAIRRQATRHDLLGRLLRGREFAIDLRGRVTLSEMASIACLSPYHFLRLFKSAFRETPMVFARRVRLQRGLDRIARGASASEAARAAGFASSSTFLRARRRSGSRRDQGMNDPRSS